MTFDSRYLNMKEAGLHISQSYRWMQRNWIVLIRDGVEAFRVPKESVKGHLYFSKASLDRYMMSCCLTMPTERPVGRLPEGHTKSRILTLFGGLDYTLPYDEYVRCEQLMCAEWAENA